MSGLRVTLLELPAIWGEPLRQLARVEEELQRKPPGDLVLLPEAALTGYAAPDLSCDLSLQAEPLGGRTSQALSALAREHGCAVVGPLIERAGPAAFNALVGFTADGAQFLHYRKRHTWYPEVWATPGEAPHPQVRLGAFTLTAAICFDVHFLEEEAADVLSTSDVLLFPSAWVDEADARPAQLSGLARRFGLCIANANWGPGLPRLRGQGGSMAVDAAGSVIARLSEGQIRLDVELRRRRP